MSLNVTGKDFHQEIATLTTSIERLRQDIEELKSSESPVHTARTVQRTKPLKSALKKCNRTSSTELQQEETFTNGLELPSHSRWNYTIFYSSFYVYLKTIKNPKLKVCIQESQLGLNSYLRIFLLHGVFLCHLVWRRWSQWLLNPRSRPSQLSIGDFGWRWQPAQHFLIAALRTCRLQGCKE